MIYCGELVEISQLGEGGLLSCEAFSNFIYVQFFYQYKQMGLELK